MPAEYAVTTLAASELRVELMPFVGAPNRTALDQQRLEEAAAILP